MPESSFTIDARILGERWTHDMENDHHGNLPDTRVELSTPIGYHPAGTTIAAVLGDFAGRLLQLENFERTFDTFSIDATITDKVFTIDAVVSGTQEGSFSIDAFINAGATFTIDAKIVGRFTIDAFVV